ncbi:ABC transporter [Streptomyces sp. NPDC056231]|uniref:ABC transporter n=1 Tax=Streptomyces sp. NPDC056231 TaxID=3345755 RepID=UPI003AABED0A
MSPATPAAPVAVLRALLRPDLRAARTRPLLAAGTAGLAVTAGPAAFHTHIEPAAAALLLRFATVLGALGLAFLLDDPAARTTEVLPVTKALRKGLRMALGLMAFGVFWGASAGLARLGVAARVREAFPLGALATEGAALAALTLALALLGLRLSASGSGSPLAAPALVLLLATVLLLPDRFALFPAPGAPNAGVAALRWGALLVLALCLSGWELRERRTAHRGKGVRRT